jgi:hypothetical protein
MNHPDFIQKCYKSRKGSHLSPNLTGVVQHPNKSKKLMQDQLEENPKILSKDRPMGLETKPVAGLTGMLWS